MSGDPVDLRSTVEGAQRGEAIKTPSRRSSATPSRMRSSAPGGTCPACGTPTAREVLEANLARLMAKEISPEQLVQVTDTEYQACLATLK